MTRFIVSVLLLAMTALATQVPSPSVPSGQTHSQVTFNKDVLPILQKNCQGCHRPGEVAPMSFLTYESTRPWAKAIKAAVVSKKMPPWFADPRYGGFRNAPELNQEEIEKLAAWTDTGAREGAAADKPGDIEWVNGWQIQPDIVVSMPAPYRVAARGAGEIKEFLIPSPFKNDTWVSSIEIRPGDRSVVHHVIVQVAERTLPRGSAWGAIAPPFLQARQGGHRNERDAGAGGLYGGNNNDRLNQSGAFTTMEAVYAPGSPPLDFRYHNSAKLIRGGQQLRIEVHYTPNGKETTDQTMVGFTLAPEPTSAGSS
jgi:hypothetical protein